MANAKIVYNSKTITFPIAGYRVQLNQERSDNFSASGVHEAICIREWDEIVTMLKNLTKEQIHDFYAWWSYARLGNSYALAVDSGLDENTTLDGSASAGQKVVPLTSTTGFSVGDYCLIKEAAGDDYEIVEIASISAGVSITAVENLLNAYASGDIFRHINYWPTVVVKNKELPFPTDGPVEYYSFDITHIEVK